MALSAREKKHAGSDARRSASEPKRRLIGWRKPVLPTVVSHLLAEYCRDSVWDMRELLIVLPGGVAQRRLGELLALSAKSEKKILYPPRIVTVGALPEQLYVAKYPFASDLVQQLAWMTALKSAPAGEITRIVPVPPSKSASQQWLELAKIFSGIHRELASDRLDFKQVVAMLGNHPEARRWQALASIQARYLAILDEHQLWDIQTARLCALNFEEPSTTNRILVVGCVDLNRTQRGFLEHVAEQVEIWIAAPEAASEYFDPYGGLVSAAWQEFHLELPDSSLLVGNSPSDQAELTCASLAELGSRYHAREVTLGVPDASLIDELKHQLEQCNVPARFGAGTPLTQSEPALLLSLIGEYLNTRSFSSFAALVRHPAVESLLRASKLDIPADWLSRIDAYYQVALPKVVGGFVNECARGAEVYRNVSKGVDRWLAKLTARPRAISNWVQPLLGAMSAAYRRQLCDLNDPVEGPLYNAASQICEAILSLRDIPTGLEPALSVSELIDWLLRNLSSMLVPEPGSESAVEMLGWLELALDDAPALIVTGMHDGVVPESVNSDAFLPNGLRRKLGMMDNAQRYARDAYTMQLMLQSREQVRIIVGKSDAHGDPLIPSRLLMACDLEKLPNRVLHLVNESEVDVLPPVEKRWKRTSGRSRLIVPRPDSLKPLSQISVTAFRDYLACPYRFYLRHVLDLRNGHDVGAELDAPMFGNLLHDTLQLLGEGSVGRSANAQEVSQFLLRKLHETALARYGPNPPAAVLIQIEQAEQRLEAFAPMQAERAEQGWEIRYTERAVDFADNILLGRDEQLHLIGRIDRIDYHPATDQWALWDYKTSENAKNPLSVHWSKQDGWKDLQLPLYRFVAKKFGVGKNLSLGYIALPRQAADIGFHIADFSPEQLREADAVAADVASRVVACEFWPAKLEPLRYDDFGRICQMGVQHVCVEPPSRRLHRHRANANSISREDSISRETVAAANRLLAAPQLTKPHLEPLLIRASAGTGKTFQLTNRLLQIILSGQDIEHVLASTFTRKAAGEIMHRVLQRLASGCLDERSRSELARSLPGVDSSAAACLAALRRVTRAIHRLRIGTLDSFFAQVARAFSLEMGLPPGWNAMDPIQEPEYQLQAIARMLDNHERKTLVDLVRMLAKGESGRQVAEQIRQTAGSGYPAYRSTESEAWDQLPLPAAPSEGAVESALLSIEAASLQDKRADQQLQKLLLSARSGNWEAVIEHGIYANIGLDPPTYYRRELDASLLAALKLLAERAAAELLPIRRNQTLASYKVLEAYDAEYVSLIRRQRELAFSDVSFYLARWMSTCSETSSDSFGAGQLEFRLDCGIQHLLLDEFQDTAPEQWQILRPLARPLGGRASSDRSFFCVGDVKQAIYGWRGGVAEIFDSVDHSIDELKRTEMSESYRSSPEVIRAVNEVFTHLPNHSNFASCDSVARRWSAEFPEHRTSRAGAPGYVRLQNGPKVDNGALVEERKEIFLSFSAQQIAELAAKSSASVGVLFRTNADVARMISLLRDRGVAASQDGGNPLTDSAAAQLLLSLIHLADHPGDTVCAFHVGTSPLAAKLPLPSPSHPHELARWFRREVARRGLGRAVESIADMLAPELSWWDQHRLEQLIQAAYAYQSTFRGRLRDFEEAVIRGRVPLPTEAQVKVMTIHKSKGLEFDAVFLPELDIDLLGSNSLLVLRGDDPCEPPDGVLRYMNSSLQALLPKDWQRAFELHKQRGINESLCLLYVAMTRARHALYMNVRPTSRGALQNFGSLLQSTLGDGSSTGTPGAVLYEDGDPAWHRAFALGRQAESAPPDESRLRSIALRTDPQSAPLRGLRVTAPSHVSQALEPVPLANAFSYSHSVGATYGTLIHAFFEQIEWLDDFEFNRDQLRRVAFATIDPEALRHLSLDRVLEDFEEMLSLASVRTALGRARYRQASFGAVPDQIEIDRERMVSLVMDNRLISGTIDRLAILMKEGRPFAAEIIDFKTDKLDPDMTLLWLEDRIEHYRPQFDIYAQVVSQLFDLPRERIGTYLLMLSMDELHKIEICPSLDPICQGAGNFE